MKLHKQLEIAATRLLEEDRAYSLAVRNHSQHRSVLSRQRVTQARNRLRKTYRDLEEIVKQLQAQRPAEKEF